VHNGELIAACVGGIERAMRELEHRGIDPAVAERVNEHLAWRGHVVQLEGLGASVRGEVVGVDPGGRLMLRSDGRTLRVNAGEVTSLRTMPAVS